MKIIAIAIILVFSLSAGAQSFNGGNLLADSIGVNPSVVWSGNSQGTPDLSPFWLNESISGTSTASAGAFLGLNTIAANPDNLNTGSESITAAILRVYDQPGSAAFGNRTNIFSQLYSNTKPTDSDPGTSFPFYSAATFNAVGSVNLGGTGTTYLTSAGELQGDNPNVQAESGATDLYGVDGEEIDVAVDAGASVAQKIGLSIIETSSDAVNGTQDDAGIMFENQSSSSPGWLNGIEFGSSSQIWPIAPSGNIIYAQKGASSSASAANGVNFSNVTFSGDAFLSPGFSVSGSGATSLQALTSTSGTFLGPIVISMPGSSVGMLELSDTTAGQSTPNKYLRSSDGDFQIINSAFTASIFQVDNSGNLTIPGTATEAAATAAGEAVNLGQTDSLYQSSLLSVSSTTTAGSITVTAAQLAGQYLADGATQTAAFTVTTDTAVNILAAMPNAVVGTSFKWRFINNDQSSTGYAGTLAGGTGVTVGTILPNPAVPKGGYEDYVFTFTAIGSSPALTVEAVGGSSAALL